ncbi:unnamed protein product [Auanema sp. JU1783]|nr:unnamed protein product [Auanema sp. JU1783]
MIFELPIEHFPVTSRCVSPSTASSSSSLCERRLPVRMPLSVAHCKDVSRAMPQKPSVCHTNFKYPIARFATMPTLKRAMTSPVLLPSTSSAAPHSDSQIFSSASSQTLIDTRPNSSLSLASKAIADSCLPLPTTSALDKHGSTPCLNSGQSFMQRMLTRGLSTSLLAQ